MPTIRRINKSKCEYLGDSIWYDRTADIFYLYDENKDEYIEIECEQNFQKN